MTTAHSTSFGMTTVLGMALHGLPVRTVCAAPAPACRAVDLYGAAELLTTQPQVFADAYGAGRLGIAAWRLHANAVRCGMEPGAAGQAWAALMRVRGGDADYRPYLTAVGDALRAEAREAESTVVEGCSATDSRPVSPAWPLATTTGARPSAQNAGVAYISGVLMAIGCGWAANTMNTHGMMDASTSLVLGVAGAMTVVVGGIWGAYRLDQRPYADEHARASQRYTVRGDVSRAIAAMEQHAAVLRAIGDVVGTLRALQAVALLYDRQQKTERAATIRAYVGRYHDGIWLPVLS